MNRRDLLVSGVSVGSLAGVVGLMQAAEAVAGPAAKTAAPATNDYGKLIESASKCVTTGLICIRHCQKELVAGNKMMADCLQSVLENVAACESLIKLAAYESSQTKDFAKLTAKLCSECAKLCEKHAHHMEACKNCMEACRACEKECLAA